MVKLRLVKERSRESDEIVDLRGLGNDRILKNESPWVFLSTTAALNAVESVCSVFGLSYKQGSSSDIIHIFKGGCQLSHKEKILELFIAGLMLINLAPEASSTLGQLSILSERIKSENNGQPPKEEDSMDFKYWTRKSHALHLPEHIRLYLQHADITVTQESIDIEFAKNFVESVKKNKIVNKKYG